MTSKVKFRYIILNINDFAFLNNKYDYVMVYVYLIRVPHKVKNTRLTYLFRRNTLPLSSIVKFRGVNKRSKRKWKLKEHQWDLIDSITSVM